MKEPLNIKKALGLAWHQVKKAEDRLDRAFQRWRAAGEGKDELAREARHWSSRGSGKVLTWMDHPVIQSYINRRVSGDPDLDWLSFFAREFRGSTMKLGLNLGCGFGGLEEHALSIGLVQGFHSFDVSRSALSAAARRLSGQPVKLEQKDINNIRLEPEAYDVAFASMSLHHLWALEHVLDEVKKALTRGGLLVINEFIGPSRFQWPEAQLEVVNEVLRALPAGFRRDLRRPFRVKRRVYPAPLDERRRDSPFEAVRSQEIVSCVEERFEVVLRRDYGGALLHPLLDGIAGNFKPDCASHVRALTRLCWLEEELEKRGVLSSDFTMIAARKE